MLSPLIPPRVASLVAVAAAGGVAAAARWWRHRHAARMEQEVAQRLPLGADGLVRGAAPIVRDRPGAPAVLLLHGAGDTPASLRYLADALHAAGYAVRAPLLTGHGRTIRHFADVSADAWLEEARAELATARQGQRWVAVLGLSMGGALAVRLAAEAADGEVRALVLLAPYLTPPRFVRVAALASHGWGAFLQYVSTLDPRSIHDERERAHALGYGVMTPRAIRALVATAGAAYAALPRLSVPTLMVQSQHDNRVPPEPARRAFDRIGTPDKRLLWRDVGGHILSVDFGRDEIFAAILDWLAVHGSTAAAPGGPPLPAG